MDLWYDQKKKNSGYLGVKYVMGSDMQCYSEKSATWKTRIMVLVEIVCDTAAQFDVLACEMQNSAVVQTLTMEKIVTEI